MTTKILDGLDLNGQRGANASDPSVGTDLATKQYVDNLVAGLSPKDSVTAAPTANVTVANPGTAVFDGVTVTAGQSLALMNQTTQSENGLYVFNGSTSALTRRSDAATGAELQGAFFTIDQGSTYGDTMYYVSTDNIVLGTTAIAFSRFAPGLVYNAGNGISISGTTIAAVAAAGGGVSVGGTGIGIDHTKVPLLYATSIGDNSATVIDVNHNLGTKDVIVQVFENATGDQVLINPNRPTVNKVTFTFPSAPTTNQYRVVVHG